MEEKKKKNIAQRMMFWRRGGGGDVTPAEAVARLRNLQDILEKKTEFLEAKIEAETKTAIENKTKNKRAALAALRRRKRFEKQLVNVDGTLSSVELQLEAMTGTALQAEVVGAMRASARAMQVANRGMSADEVADLRDELSDLMEDSEEIGNLLAQPLGGSGDVDEDELLAELEELEQQELTDDLCNLTLQMPSVPTNSIEEGEAAAKGRKKTKHQAEEDEDEAELKKLADWL